MRQWPDAVIELFDRDPVRSGRAGFVPGSVAINYNNGASGQSTSRAIQGNAVSAANLIVSNSPSYDFGTRPSQHDGAVIFGIEHGGTAEDVDRRRWFDGAV